MRRAHEERRQQRWSFDRERETRLTLPYSSEEAAGAQPIIPAIAQGPLDDPPGPVSPAWCPARKAATVSSCNEGGTSAGRSDVVRGQAVVLFQEETLLLAMSFGCLASRHHHLRAHASSSTPSKSPCIRLHENRHVPSAAAKSCMPSPHFFTDPICNEIFPTNANQKLILCTSLSSQDVPFVAAGWSPYFGQHFFWARV